MKMLMIEMLPDDDNVLQMLKEDRQRSENAGEDRKSFVDRECKKLFQAYIATNNSKYYRAYEIITQMYHRQRS